MNNHPIVNVNKFWKDGYVLLKSVFSNDEVEQIRERVLHTVEEEKAKGSVDISNNQTKITLYGDLLSYEHLRSVVYDERILYIAREILGAGPVYFGDSSCNIQSGRLMDRSVGWHRDNREPDRYTGTGKDWDGRYTLIRIGLYLQDHAKHSGGVGVKRGSHENPNRSILFRKVMRKIFKVIIYPGKSMFVDSEVGDLVVWNLRTFHSGNSSRLKFALKIRLSLWLERKLPAWLKAPEERDRISMFITYGINDQHRERFSEYLMSRRDYDRHRERSRFGQEVWSQLEGKDLDVIRIFPEYGTPE